MGSPQGQLKRDLIAYAHSLGFERVGITTAEPLIREGAFLTAWVAQGRAGEMKYMERDPERRSRPAELLPAARSVIALAMNYDVAHSSSPAEAAGNDDKEGRLSRYTRGKDYHKVMTKRLESFVRYAGALAPGAECRAFVDTGPLLERAFARRAGLGFIGKNTMLITKGLGSWVFLASVITTLELPADAPDERSCGECRLCIDACPTEAITAPFELDPRRCIAYLTIESKQEIPQRLRPRMGGWIFGCDICQEVCPHNARRTGKGNHVELADLLSLDSDDDFRRQFDGTVLLRAGREGLLRNACVAAANLGRTDLNSRLQNLAGNDSSPIVREHAAWALERLATQAVAPSD